MDDSSLSYDDLPLGCSTFSVQAQLKRMADLLLLLLCFCLLHPSLLFGAVVDLA